MEEEAEKSRDARLEAWGRDDFSVYKPKKVQQTLEQEWRNETVEMEVNFPNLYNVQVTVMLNYICIESPLAINESTSTSSI